MDTFATKRGSSQTTIFSIAAATKKKSASCATSSPAQLQLLVGGLRLRCPAAAAAYLDRTAHGRSSVGVL